LNGNQITHNVTSPCGHRINIFDHHFFHLVKLDDSQKQKPLLMSSEKATILSNTDDFGPYTYDKQRAIYLESAMLCLTQPDEVWDNPHLRSARWVYIKHFNATPYVCTVFLLSERPEGPVPNTSFPGKVRDIRKWGVGTKIYP
jgi:hypothetical protein